MNEIAMFVGYSVLFLVWLIIAATLAFACWLVWSLALNAVRKWKSDLKVRRQQQEWANRTFPEAERFRNRGGDGAA